MNKVKLTDTQCCGGNCGCSGQETPKDSNIIEDFISDPNDIENRRGSKVSKLPGNDDSFDETNFYPFKSISEVIRRRIIEDNGAFFGNNNISEYLQEGELELLQNEVEQKYDAFLRSLIIDIDEDHNTNGTSNRVAKMNLREIFRGRYEPRPKITEFPNVSSYDQLYITGPITVRSMCSHHMMPIVGEAFIGVYPGTNVIGLSKFNRLVDWVASRPQIQEEMTSQIADEIEKATNPEGVAVIVKAAHFCMSHRGIRESESARMTTSVMRGCFRTDDKIRREFLTLITSK